MEPRPLRDVHSGVLFFVVALLIARVMYDLVRLLARLLFDSITYSLQSIAPSLPPPSLPLSCVSCPSSSIDDGSIGMDVENGRIIGTHTTVHSQTQTIECSGSTANTSMRWCANLVSNDEWHHVRPRRN